VATPVAVEVAAKVVLDVRAVAVAVEGRSKTNIFQ